MLPSILCAQGPSGLISLLLLLWRETFWRINSIHSSQPRQPLHANVLEVNAYVQCERAQDLVESILEVFGDSPVLTVPAPGNVGDSDEDSLGLLLPTRETILRWIEFDVDMPGRKPTRDVEAGHGLGNGLVLLKMTRRGLEGGRVSRPAWLM
jgi:hypothetical protein